MKLPVMVRSSHFAISRSNHSVSTTWPRLLTGFAHVGYLPKGRVVGISTIARVVDTFDRRLQIQERLTAQIADVIQKVLQPEGGAVVVKATHGCMTIRGEVIEDHIREHVVEPAKASERVEGGERTCRSGSVLSQIRAEL